MKRKLNMMELDRQEERSNANLINLFTLMVGMKNKIINIIKGDK